MNCAGHTHMYRNCPLSSLGGLATLVNYIYTVTDQPLVSVTPAWGPSDGESFGSQPLEPYWIAAAFSDPQSPSCWTPPVHSHIVNIPMFEVSSCLSRVYTKIFTLYQCSKSALVYLEYTLKYLPFTNSQSQLLFI